MKDLKEIANSAILNYLDSGELEKKINDGIRHAFDDCISNAFKWGSFKKQIQEVIEEKLAISTREIDLHSYNAVMLEALKGQISHFTNKQALEGFNKVLSDTFGEAPKEISINEIVEKILDDWKGDDPCNCDEKTATIEFKRNPGSYSLEITDGEKYSSNKYQLYFLDDTLRISHRQDLNPTTLYGIEGFLFKLYSAGTKITGLDEFDPDKFDLNLGYNHDY